MNESKIKLGKKYRDTITSFEGTAVARHEYIHGCTRITLQSLEGGDIKEFTFDGPALEEVETGSKFSSRKTGGPRTTGVAKSTG